MSPARNVVGGSDKTFGNRNRSVPRNMAAMDAMKAIHAVVIHSSRKPRRDSVLAAGFGGAGLTGAVPAVGVGVGTGSGIVPPLFGVRRGSPLSFLFGRMRPSYRYVVALRPWSSTGQPAARPNKAKSVPIKACGLDRGNVRFRSAAAA